MRPDFVLLVAGVTLTSALPFVKVSAQTPAAPAVVVTGVVVTDDAPPRPVARAIVTIVGAAMPAGRSAVTDDSGRFSITNVPPGSATMSAAKRGLITAWHGARRPGKIGTPLMLAAGQSANVTLTMGRAAVLAGAIRDERGDPVSGLYVWAFDPRPGLQAFRNSNPGNRGQAPVRTDGRGAYRIFGLQPGEYVVVALAPASEAQPVLARAAEEVDAIFAQLRQGATRPSGIAAAAPPLTRGRPMTHAPTYLPGTVAFRDATRVKLAAGDERSGLDFVMQPVPVSAVDGVVTVADGPMPSVVNLRVVADDALELIALAGARAVVAQPPGADGRFRLTGLVPGRHTITARANRQWTPATAGARGVAAAPSGEPSEMLYAIEEVVVSGQDATGLTVRLQRGARLSGRVTIDPASTSRPGDLSQSRVTLTTAPGTVASMDILDRTMAVAAAPVRADGSFELAGIGPGSYQLQWVPAAGSATGWWLRSATVGGADILDTSLRVVSSAGDQSGAVLLVTDRRSELSGLLQSADGRAAPAHDVIVMPADRALWTPGSRRIRSTRPGADGRYRFSDLPAGPYLLAAVTELDPIDLQSPEFLEQLVSSAVKVTVTDGEKRVQDLRIAR